MKKIFLCIILMSLLFTISCSDAKISNFTAIGNEANVRCYSGGVIVYEGTSSGKVETEEGSDGWYFKDKKSRKLIRTNADCVVIN